MDCVDMIIEISIIWRIPYCDVATMSSLSMRSVYYIKNRETKPRRSTKELIEKSYELTILLVDKFGLKGAREWVHSGDDSTWEALISGNLALVEKRALQDL